MLILKETLKGTMTVPIALAVVLALFSILIGWNLFSTVAFWLLLVPILTIYLPTITSRNKNHMLESLAGLLIFYALMVFMIYDHFNTDYFQIMMLSCVVNIFPIALITRLRKKSSTQ